MFSFVFPFFFFLFLFLKPFLVHLLKFNRISALEPTFLARRYEGSVQQTKKKPNKKKLNKSYGQKYYQQYLPSARDTYKFKK